ncbi:MAG: sodium:proton exchanger [Candidatus Magasanikbacteria bacterium CG1_02_41_34]|nr:MAG: sodium:proton exchanger [Candidatus Magasanikbacteria bacterium CG1_02_41_34]
MLTSPLISLGLLILGLGILVKSANWLVSGSSSIAKKWGISSLVIGLTVVSFGTSAPEFLVNLISAFHGNTDLAIGNIIGSNTANILLILGITTIITPLAVKKNTTFKEIPFAMLAAVLVILFGNDSFFDGNSFNAITRTDGFAFLALFVIFLYYTYGISKIKGEKEHIDEYSWITSMGLALGGIIGLTIGGELIVRHASNLAVYAGLSDRIIGLTIVAIGTSLPELATSVVAAMNKKADLAIGNIVGSNIFNVFWILGITSIIKPIPFNASINVDAIFSAFAALLLFIAVIIGKHRIEKWHGYVFFFLYLGYLGFLVIAPECLPLYCK